MEGRGPLDRSGESSRFLGRSFSKPAIRSTRLPYSDATEDSHISSIGSGSRAFWWRIFPAHGISCPCQILREVRACSGEFRHPRVGGRHRHDGHASRRSRRETTAHGVQDSDAGEKWAIPISILNDAVGT